MAAGRDFLARIPRRSAVLGGLTLLGIAINLLLAWHTDVDMRQRGLEQALSNGRQILVAFTDHATRLLDNGDSQLRAARMVYQRLGGGDEFRAFLADTKVLHSESLIVATTFSNRDGQIVFDSEKRQVLNVTAGGLDYFTFFQAHDDDVPYIDATRFGRVWPQYLFRIVRRLSRNGQFDGVAILNMRPEHLAKFIRQFDLGPNATYSILTLDHRLIVRQPTPPQGSYGVRQDGMDLWRRIGDRQSGPYRGISTLDGYQRIYQYQILADYPLVVQVGISEQDVLATLAGARIANVLQATFFTVVSAGFCGLVLLVLHKAEALRASNTQLDRLGRRNTLLLESVRHGIYGVDREHRTTFVNSAALAMLGLTEEEMLGQDQHSLFHHHRQDGTTYPDNQCPIGLTLEDGQFRHDDDEWFWRKDGSGFPVAMTISSVIEFGCRVGAVVVFEDITKRKALELKLKETNIELGLLARELNELARTDTLTGLANRRAFAEAAEAELDRCRRFGSSAAVLMIDVDRFKAVNDIHGHEAGDRVLVSLATVLKTMARTTDLPARFGGEEFVFLLVGTDLSGASEMAERIRQAVAQIVVETPSGDIRITLSIGVASVGCADVDWSEAIRKADLGLYRAKESGRNRVVTIADEDEPMGVAESTETRS